jgi:hypothetical protein
LGDAAVGVSSPYGYPYALDPGDPALGGEESEPAVMAFERPVCVRPLIIQIKPMGHAAHLPRVIYGRPPIC